MGRYYYGSIEGKFWFGIQTSGDISNLVTITPEICYLWKVCSCSANIDEGYCNDCYDSKEEHHHAVVDEDSEDEDDSLYIEADMVSYRVKKDTHYKELKTNMDALRLKIEPEIIAEFDKIEQNDEILNAFTGVFGKMEKQLNIIEKKQNEVIESSLHNDRNELVARYTIGYQLEYCLRTTDEDCYVDCEC